MIKKLLSFYLSLSLVLSLTSCSIHNSDSDEAITKVTPTSIYTGEEISKESELNIPFMVMIENSSASRPQSGLSQADIIYETSAEGGIPRFVALFQSKSPTKIGPVRSVRPYFVEIAKEHNLPIAHCGGSQDALNMLTKSSFPPSINEISEGDYFWRDKTKQPPHNLYTSSEKIRSFISEKNLLNDSWKDSRSFFTFDDKYFSSEDLKLAEALSITINKYYNTSYSYNNGLYTKYMDGKKAIDDYNNEALTFSNIIIQKTNITLNPDGTHLDIDLTGDGTGYLLSQGKVIDIKWSNNNNKTNLTDLNGNTIKLSPGKTIWHIIDTKTNVSF